jgi:hypothetical protein
MYLINVECIELKRETGRSKVVLTNPAHISEVAGYAVQCCNLLSLAEDPCIAAVHHALSTMGLSRIAALRCPSDALMGCWKNQVKIFCCPIARFRTSDP